MKPFRTIAITLTQIPLLLFVGGSHDLLFGFNQTTEGFHTLLGLFVAVPLVNLAWLIAESRRSYRLARSQGMNRSILLPFVALFFLFEALAIDLYILSTARM